MLKKRSKNGYNPNFSLKRYQAVIIDQIEEENKI